MSEAPDVTEVIKPSDPGAQALVDVDGKCPFDYYKAARARTSVAFEESTGKWVAATYSAVSSVLTDEETFPRLMPEEIVSDPKYVRTLAIPFFLTGEDRLEHHRWWLDIFNARELKRYREGIVADVVDAIVDRLATQGHAELAEDFAEPVADRVIAAVLGLPWDDDTWMSELRANFDKIERYKASIYLKPEVAVPLAEDALAGTYRIDELMRPYVERRKVKPDETVMSRALHDEAMTGWEEEALYGLLRTFFTGGSGTTSVQLVNAVYLMLSTDGMKELISQGDEKHTARFLEEALRLLPTNHFRIRCVVEDTELEGADLHAGDSIAALIAAGNRDETRYPNPDQVDLGRANGRQHLTFSVGIGACVGSGLARVILQVALSRLAVRLPNLRLDPPAGEPTLGGSMFRQMHPLAVLFDAKQP
jgi:pentalenic acid synthase